MAGLTQEAVRDRLGFKKKQRPNFKITFIKGAYTFGILLFNKGIIISIHITASAYILLSLKHWYEITR